MENRIAEYIAWFTPKTKFLERKFRRHLRRSRKAAKRSRDINKQLAID